LKLIRPRIAIVSTTVEEQRQSRPDDDAMIHVSLPSSDAGCRYAAAPPRNRELRGRAIGLSTPSYRTATLTC
jgi:hypothetical protein